MTPRIVVFIFKNYNCNNYQTSHFLLRFILLSMGQWNVSENSGILESAPLTLKHKHGCIVDFVANFEKNVWRKLKLVIFKHSSLKNLAQQFNCRTFQMPNALETKDSKKSKLIIFISNAFEVWKSLMFKMDLTYLVNYYFPSLINQSEYTIL